MADGFATQKIKNPEDDYILGDVLGKGAVGQVYMGKDRASGVVVALKRVEIKTADQLEECEREIGLMRGLNESPHVVQYYHNYYWQKEIWVALELCSRGSVTDLLDATTPRGFPEPFIATVLSGMAQGLAFLHERAIIHRDIKPANVLVSENGAIKLADFGISKVLEEDGAHAKTMVGTPQYLSPELMLSGQGGGVDAGYGPKVDVWATGICAIEMAEGAPPFSELSPLMVMYKLAEPTLAISLRDPDRWSDAFVQLVRACVQVKPEERPSSADLVEAPLCASAEPLLDVDSMLRQCRPDPRTDIEVIRSVSGKRGDRVMIQCGLQRSSGDEVAVKRVQLATDSDLQTAQATVAAYSRWPSHKHLTRYIDHYVDQGEDGDGAAGGSDSLSSLVLVSEFCGRGSLADSLRKSRATSASDTASGYPADDQVVAVATALVNALRVLHRLLPAVVHGAVSPGAVLFTYDNSIKLGDPVGRASHLYQLDDSSLPFVAPDALPGDGSSALCFSAKADVWAMGATLVAMADRRPLFSKWLEEHDRQGLLSAMRQSGDQGLAASKSSDGPSDAPPQAPSDHGGLH